MFGTLQCHIQSPPPNLGGVPKIGLITHATLALEEFLVLESNVTGNEKSTEDWLDFGNLERTNSLKKKKFSYTFLASVTHIPNG